MPDDEDSALAMPHAVVVDPAFDWEDDRPPRVPWNDSVIYEVHVKGFTKRLGALPSTCAAPTRASRPTRRSPTYAISV